jgi:hypothetical protein
MSAGQGRVAAQWKKPPFFLRSHYFVVLMGDDLGWSDIG